MKTAVMTDTNSGIFPEEARALGAWSIPMPILVDGDVLYEGSGIDHSELFAAMDAGRSVSTSQPTPGDISSMWDAILESGYDEIVYIPMSSALSSACANAKTLATLYDGRVNVVDNRRISVTQKASVLDALEMTQQGMDGAAICSDLERRAYDASIYLAVSDLTYLKRGGRITPAVAAIGSMLKIKPILAIQGDKLDAFSRQHGMTKAFAAMFKTVHQDVANRFGGDESSVLAYVAATGYSKEEEAGFLETCAREFPKTQASYDRLPVSIAVHTGPGALGVGVSLKSSAYRR